MAQNESKPAPISAETKIITLPGAHVQQAGGGREEPSYSSLCVHRSARVPDGFGPFLKSSDGNCRNRIAQKTLFSNAANDDDQFATD